MKRTLAITAALLIVVCCLVDHVSAQDTPAPGTQTKTPRWALQFSIEDNFQLAAFSGATLSLKRQSSPSRAWRLGITTRFESRNTETGASHSENDMINVNVALPYYRLYYFKADGVIRPYWGVGIRPAWLHRTSESRQNGQLINKQVLNDLGVGLTGAVGVEWYFTESLSLLAEYGSLLAYTRSHREDKSAVTGKRTTETSVVEFDWEQVRFGLTAYW